MEQKRLDYIDTAKGILIMFVILRAHRLAFNGLL